MAPLLMLLALGAIDLGQYANVYQKVSDASREGARVAARHKTTSTSQVETAVRSYLQEASPDVSAAALASAAQITVSYANGTTIPTGDLTKVSTGLPVCVRVTLQYGPVRWLRGFKGLDGRTIETTTMMRRE